MTLFKSRSATKNDNMKTRGKKYSMNPGSLTSSQKEFQKTKRGNDQGNYTINLPESKEVTFHIGRFISR